jgi:Sigma-70, region 4/Bacterial RNA polymerase, alpha chain C terminal domain
LCPDSISVNTEVPIDLLDLSARPANAIREHGIDSVRRLMNFPRQEFRGLRAIGEKSLAEVQSKLFNYLAGTSSGISSFYEGKETSSALKVLRTKGLVNTMLRSLTRQQREVIAERYGLWNGISGSLRGIGRKLGLSGERIRQVEKKALARLRGMFGSGALSEIIARKIGNSQDVDAKVAGGVLTKDEALSCMADDCSQEQAALALSLFNQVECPGGDILTKYVAEVEPGVYCIKSVARRYALLLKLMKSALREKPVSESKLRDDILGKVGNVPKTEQLKLMERMLSLSPAVTRTPDGEIALAHWIKIYGQSASRRAEGVLLRLGRPAHFREISNRIPTMFGSSKESKASTVHNALQLSPETFIRVRAGTYGLRVWDLRSTQRRPDKL